MKKSTLTSILFLLFGIRVFSHSVPPDSLYLGQIPPGNIPKIFNLSVSPGFFAAERIAISNDGSEIYYTEVHGYYPVNSPRIKSYIYSGGQWTGPFTVFQNYMAAGLSVTGDTMYFQNGNTVPQTFFSSKNGSSWSNPKRILMSLNSAHYLQVTNNENYYISSRSSTGLGAGDWCKLFINGADTTASSLGLPLNTAGDNLDFIVSRDDSLMIVAKPGGLCISYHKPDSKWTNPKNLGSTINFGLGMWGPYVSSDNKYLFYSTGTNPNYSDTYVYWVRIDGLIDSLRHTNFIPYVKNLIPNQTADIGVLFNFTIPDSTFIDDDGNNTLTFGAKLVNGSPLPAWLTFDSLTASFSGTPPNVETLMIRVKATDNTGVNASTTFKITVHDPTAIDQIKGHGVRIFPNPTFGLINISLDEISGKTVKVEISNLEGKVIMTDAFKKDINIDLAANPKGIYILKLFIDNEIIIRKVCME
ncbi:MAG: putative Ig domain-containing protein [Bacteroidales bacterium]|jgi:hypothetical protein|nr:putative Ig domain-containing protein [Bacteroidales bacterium]